MADDEANIKVRVADRAKQSLRKANRFARGRVGKAAGGVVSVSALASAVTGQVQSAATGGFGDLAAGALGPTMEALKWFPQSQILARARMMNQPTGFFQASGREDTAEGKERIARKAKHSFIEGTKSDRLRLQGMRRAALQSEFAGPGAKELEVGLQWILDKAKEINAELSKKVAK